MKNLHWDSELRRTIKTFPLNVLVRKKAPSKAGVLADPPLLGCQLCTRPDEQRRAAEKELAEKQAQLEQRRK